MSIRLRLKIHNNNLAIGAIFAVRADRASLGRKSIDTHTHTQPTTVPAAGQANRAGCGLFTASWRTTNGCQACGMLPRQETAYPLSVSVASGQVHCQERGVGGREGTAASQLHSMHQNVTGRNVLPI